MINSSFLSVETPIKGPIRRSDEVTPVKSVNLTKRFRPSPQIQRQLMQFERVHRFQYHESVRFLPLNELRITFKLVGALSEFFKQTIDIPDTVKKYEEAAVDSKYFHAQMRDYISEEFDCQIDYSFCIVSVLHYINIFEVCLEDALCELFQFSTSQSLCQQCVSGDDHQERKELADRHNFNLLNGLLMVKEVSDISDSDDSFDDPAFCGGEDLVSDSSDPSLSEKDTDMSDKISNDADADFLFNPFTIDDDHSSDVEFSFNPFEVCADESDVFNSTVNPLAGCNGGLKTLSDCSPVAHIKKKKTSIVITVGKAF